MARCLEAVNHTAAFGAAAAAAPGEGALHMAHSRSLPILPRHDSQLGLDGPADSMDSGPVYSGMMSPTKADRAALRGGGGGLYGGAVVSSGEDDRLTGHPGHAVLCMATANGLLFSGGADATIRVRRGEEGALVCWQLLAACVAASVSTARDPFCRG